MVARILVAVFLQLAVAPVWSQVDDSDGLKTVYKWTREDGTVDYFTGESLLEDLHRFNSEREREAALSPDSPGGKNGAFNRNLVRQLEQYDRSQSADDARIFLCECARFVLGALDDALNGSLAGVRNAQLSFRRSWVKHRLSGIFPSGLNRVDVGWGEGCPEWQWDSPEQRCAFADGMFGVAGEWGETLATIGLFGPMGRLAAIERVEEDVREALSCGVADE